MHTSIHAFINFGTQTVCIMHAHIYSCGRCDGTIAPFLGKSSLAVHELPTRSTSLDLRSFSRLQFYVYHFSYFSD